MRIELLNNTGPFVGMRIALTVSDADHLINQLRLLKSSSEQHFHLTADSESMFVDLEVGVQGADEQSNANMTGIAIKPDDT